MEEKLAREAQEAGDSFEKGELSLSSGRQEEILAQDAAPEADTETDSSPGRSKPIENSKHDEL